MSIIQRTKDAIICYNDRMSYQDILNSPDFRRNSNAVADRGIKIFFSALTSASIAAFHFLKSMVMMALGK